MGRRVAAGIRQGRTALILLATAAVGALLVRPPKWLVILLAAADLWMGWLWLCRRHPLVAIAIFGFLRACSAGDGRSMRLFQTRRASS